MKISIIMNKIMNIEEYKFRQYGINKIDVLRFIKYNRLNYNEYLSDELILENVLDLYRHSIPCVLDNGKIYNKINYNRI